MSQQPSVPTSKAPELGKDKEQWVVTMKFSCVRCKQAFQTRDELWAHYDRTRHDKYSAWKK